ncbi:hypothetical protein ALC152_03970 [Arcobacter sp. 15-2]|uniref:phage tail fiber protein n=1 Tax=Arcobacter sp. 15-2 TaxID=3374109 RepID=UPI00399D1834
MNIETLTPEELTHDVFKSQIVGLVKKYQKIIDDDTTEKDTLKWINEELEQLSTWLTTLNDIDITVTYENLQEQLLTSQSKYDEFVSTLNTKLEEINTTFEQKEKEITQTFEQKSTSIDQTFEQKETEINETFNNLGSTIEQTFEQKENEITQTFSQLENFKGPQGIKGDKGDKGDQGIQGIKGDKGDVGTTDYNELTNKPILDVAQSLTSSDDIFQNVYDKNGTYKWGSVPLNAPTSYAVMQRISRGSGFSQIVIGLISGRMFFNNVYGSSDSSFKEVLHTQNTTIDANGFIKTSSPVLNLYTDKIDIHNLQDFGATPTMTKLEKGVYEIKNTLGLRIGSHYIETPHDRNGNKYFNVEWEQNIEPTTNDGILKEYINDIVLIVKVYTRVWNPTTGIHDNGELIDINELQSRFIQLRFNELKKEEPIMEDEPND